MNMRWLLPKVRIDAYESSAAFGIELTWRQGIGVGVGLGLVDLWFGWPRHNN